MTQPWETQRQAPTSTTNGKSLTYLIPVAAVAFFLGSYFPLKPVDLPDWNRPAATYRIEKSSWILLIEETAERTKFPWLATVMSDRGYWNSLKSAGYTWQFYDIESDDIAEYRQDATKAGLPALLVVSPAGRVKLAKSCPPTTASIDELLKGVR